MPPQRSSRLRASEVAADTKRNFIPLIKNYSDFFSPYSFLYPQPILQCTIQRRKPTTRPPLFKIEVGDPVMKALAYAAMDTQQNSPESNNYPIPPLGGILSDTVVVYRGPNDRYDRLGRWFDLPVVSIPPTRRPKLKDNGLKYSFTEEREMTRDKLRGALRICLYNGYDRVVIGDFGLGNGHRNPPQELAELWRDVFLFDPDLRGQFAYVAFVFEDPQQSTIRHIVDEIAKKENGSGGKSRSGFLNSFSTDQSHADIPTDRQIFEQVFDPAVVDRILRQPDPRYGLDMITT
ncbi:hypothetical protein BFJ65_g18615 [Fusarium oxysporum f. sp. cepae]|uniref:Microbial-type PARG catalytic domain-containing protein n=1 Tax=Fusarium oxysporum f. sp. cepae TaxID=396571 RepID=A0A3L6MQJ6_FUSOX|nr:hypothetical protein BFJ65_g18615 [Fusarium oxysporum f. sp. cepae]